MDSWNFINYNQDIETILENFKNAAEIHKKVRTDLKKMIQSKEVLNMKYFDIANHIEGLIKTHSKFDKNNVFKSGIGFPIGLSINECAAH